MKNNVNPEVIVTSALKVNFRDEHEDDKLGCENATVSVEQQMNVRLTTDTETQCLRT